MYLCHIYTGKEYEAHQRYIGRRTIVFELLNIVNCDWVLKTYKSIIKYTIQPLEQIVRTLYIRENLQRHIFH